MLSVCISRQSIRQLASRQSGTELEREKIQTYKLAAPHMFWAPAPSCNAWCFHLTHSAAGCARPPRAAGTTLPRTAAGCARPPPRHAWILLRCPPRPVDPADRAAVLAGEGDVRAPARISFGHGKEGGIRGFGRRRRRGLGGIERRNWGSISREGTRSSCPAEDFFTEWDPPYLCFLGEPL